MSNRFYSFFLTCLMLLCGAATISARAEEADPVISVGLYYGNDALPSANLANEVGSGYRIGYFNDSRNFVSLYSVPEEKISVLKDKTIYLASDKSYSDAKPASSAGAVYPYHAQCETVFDDMDEAAEAAAEIAAASGIPSFPAYINGQARVRSGSYQTTSAAQSAASELQASTGYRFSTAGNSTSCYTVTETKSDRILLEFDSTGRYLGIMPKASGNAEAETWFKNYTYYGGFEYRRINGNDITVINMVGLHSYTKGVIPYEMSASWPEEALKAQAMCAKSYALSNKNKHKTYGFDVCNSTDCQVYRGTKSANDYTDGIVDDTYGSFVTYEGKHITPYYHSSDGGATEDSENVWTTAVPYLRGVFDPYEDLKTATHGIWSYDLDLDDVTEILQGKGYKIGRVVDVYVDEYTRMGNVYRLTFVDETGKKLSFEKGTVRSVLSSDAKNIHTYSQRYSINTKLSLYVHDSRSLLPSSLQNTYAVGAGGKIKKVVPSWEELSVLSASGKQSLSPNRISMVLEGTGWGHNVGMSQNGAKGMALQGYSYEEILKFYFTGVEITRAY